MPAQKLKPPEYVLGEHYPEATLEDGTKAPVIAWIWARTVTCPNPACGIEMPLLRSWWLSKKKGKEAWVRPIIVADADADADAGRSSGKRMKFEVGHGAVGAPAIEGHATVGRNGTTCAACGSAVDLKYLRAEGKRGALGARLLAIVAEGPRQRLYLDPASDHEMAAAVSAAPDAPDAVLATHPQYMGAPRYGMSRARDLFTDRQLLALTTFSDLVMEVRERVLRDAVAIGGSPGARLESGGTDAEAYADAVATYLGLVVSKMTNLSSTLTSWMPDRGAFREVFARQAIPMVWDSAEANVMFTGGGGWSTFLGRVADVIARLDGTSLASVSQSDARDAIARPGVVSTDPPYYDNVPYADLSDFFYVWLRRSLRTVHPDLLATVLVPKADELVADSQRHDSKEGARAFFEDGFRRVFTRARETASVVPIQGVMVRRASVMGPVGRGALG